MKKILFGILIVLTWYLAAMYRQDALMAAAVMETMVYMSMMLCVRYMKKNTQIAFLQNSMIVNRAEYIECPFLINNRGVLPISRIRIRFSYIYEGETVRKHITFSGNVDRNRKDRAKVRVPVSWSGRLSVCMEKTEIFDYFSLFKVRTKTKENITITLLPPDRRIHLLTELAKDTAGSLQDEASLRGCGNGEEYAQVREYTQGDHYRFIHWKLSARTETLFVREYQEAEKKTVIICLDFCRYDEKSIKEISAFFEILWALVSGLLEEDFSVRMDWRNRDGIRVSRTAETGHASHSLASVFEELYEKDWILEGQDRSIYEESERVFCFGMNLKLTYCEEEIFCFSQEHFEDERKIAEETG